MQIADAATTLETGLNDKVSQHIVAFSGVWISDSHANAVLCWTQS